MTDSLLSNSIRTSYIAMSLSVRWLQINRTMAVKIGHYMCIALYVRNDSALLSETTDNRHRLCSIALVSAQIRGKRVGHIVHLPTRENSTGC